MSQGVPTKVIAAICGLSAFAVAIIAGLTVDNPVEVVLVRALVAMVLCQVLGTAIGAILEHVGRDAIKKHQDARPIPDARGGRADTVAPSGAGAASA